MAPVPVCGFGPGAVSRVGSAVCGRVRRAGRPVARAPGVVRHARRGLWREEWTEPLRGLRVVVAFDNNEGDQARERVAALRSAGIDARRLDLRDLGLTIPKGDVSDYLAGGGDPKRLRSPRRVFRRRR